MRLARFIRANKGSIIAGWERLTETVAPSGDHMGACTLRGHIDKILDLIVTDMEAAQSHLERGETYCREGPGCREKPGIQPKPAAAEAPALLSYDHGFHMRRMIREYGALRTAVVGVWKASHTTMSMEDVDDLTRVDEAVDQALTEAITDYSQKLELSQSLFLGILSHDLRNPLGAISMSAELMTRFGALSTRQIMLNAQMADSSARATEIIDSLLDIARSRLGSGLSIVRQPMDMGLVGGQLVDEMRAIYPNRKFDLEVSGDVTGVWDKVRMGQVFSNLIGNAVQYGFRSAPIKIGVRGTIRDVVVSVHNEGTPIRAEVLGDIFRAFTRAPSTSPTQGNAASTNLGLGLFISNEIVKAQGGEIQVSSSEEDGTVFKIRFPRTREAPGPTSVSPREPFGGYPPSRTGPNPHFTIIFAAVVSGAGSALGYVVARTIQSPWNGLLKWLCRRGACVGNDG